MHEEAGDALGLVITMVRKVGDEFIVGQASCLWEAIHAFSDFDVDIAIVIS